MYESAVNNKKIMYGVDVLSCLNKAMSNNEKYVSGSFLTGDLYTKKFIIDVAFKLNSPLQDRVKINYLKSTRVGGQGTLLEGSVKVSSQEYEYTTGTGPKNYSPNNGATYNDGPASFKSVFSKLFKNNKYSTFVLKSGFNWDNIIESNTYESQISQVNSKASDGFYHILASENDSTDSENSGYKIELNSEGKYELNIGNNYKPFKKAETSEQVKEFLASATELTIDVKHNLTQAEKGNNSDEEQKATLKYKCVGVDSNGQNVQGWSSARWETSLYDFKKRKFKCDSVRYSDDTGRIISMVFVEYK
jgi:hypothetical protein